MLAHAEHEFKLARPEKDGRPARAHLEAVLKRPGLALKTRGELERMLDGPEFPPILGPVWEDFLHLSARRGSGGMGPARITDLDIAAYVALRGITLTPFEVDLISKLDELFLATMVPALAAHAAQSAKQESR